MMIFIAALIGLLVGGLLNALADTLPDYERPTLPRYPDGSTRPPIAWLGITAFLFGLRTPPDKSGDERDTVNLRSPVNLQRLSWRYPITEIATAFAFALTVWRIDILRTSEPINTVQTLFWLIYMALFVLIFVIDVEHRLILFSVTIPGILLALLDAVLTPGIGIQPDAWMASAEPRLRTALLGGGIGFGIFFLFYVGGFLYTLVASRMRGEQVDEVAFGYGDVMLITMCGIILGWQPLILSIFLTVVFGAIGAVVFLIIQRIRGGDGGITSALPYGPYIIISATLMLMFPDVMQDFFFMVYGWLY